MGVKEKLIVALKAEMERMKNLPHFNPTDHTFTIKYLETGVKMPYYTKYELYGATVEDFDTVCKDYGVL